MMGQQVGLTREEEIFLIECMVMSAKEGYYLSNRWELENMDDKDVLRLLAKLLGGEKQLEKLKIDDLDDLEFLNDDDIKEALGL